MRNYAMVIRNLKHARKIFETIPEEKVDLNDFVVEGPDDNENPLEHPCQTLACGAGWLIMHPDYNDGGRWMRDRGSLDWEFVVPTKVRRPEWSKTEDGDWVLPAIRGEVVHPMGHMGEKLGLTPEEATELFNVRSHRDDYLDEGRISDEPSLTDKQVWLMRCDALIATLKKKARRQHERS